MDNKLPQRPRSHEIEDIARGSFLEKKPPSWACNESKSDYGWDILVNIPTGPQQVGDDFFVQLKGSDSINYLKESNELSHSLEVKTINWLLAKPIPSMLAVCDVQNQTKPIFWIWLLAAVSKLDQSNPSWKTQETITIRIPLVNLFNPEMFPSIEAEVKEHHEIIRFNQQLFRAVRSQPLTHFSVEIGRSEATFHQKRDLLTRLDKVGLVGLTENDDYLEAEVYGEVDLTLQRKIREASILVHAFQVDAANRILDTLQEQIVHAPIGIKAAYVNCQGVVALYQRDDHRALQAFQEALALKPHETKYAVNVLTVEYKIAVEGKTELPLDWDDRLAKILAQKPDYEGVIRLKTSRLARVENRDTAANYLKNSNLWRTNKKDALATLAEIFREHGDIDEALKLIDQAEKDGGKDSNDPLLFSLKGGLLLDKAIGSTITDRADVIRGYGPTDLDLGKLRASAEAYLRACKLYSQCGFPSLAEPTFLNAATALQLMGNHQTVERLARSFLELHPESGFLHGALAMSLCHNDDPVSAIEHAHTAFKLKPEISQYYINLLIVLLAADDCDELIKQASERQKQGFHDPREECFTRAIIAVAYAEKGKFDLADSQIQILFENPNSYSEGAATQAAIAKRRGVSNKDIAALLRNHLSKLPNDPYIITVLVHHLLPPTDETADEIINCLNRIKDGRQLSPAEIFALGRAYMKKNSLDNALLAFQSGRGRYPNDTRFLLELAHVLISKGDDEAAYEVMSEYVKLADQDPTNYWNLGLLARSTGRLDEAITVLQKALSREQDPIVIRKLHFFLFDAKRRQGAPSKELLRHVISFGELTNGDPDEDARFLIMALLTPSDEQGSEDEESKEWRQKILARLESFITAHPKSKVLRRITIPEGVSEESQVLHFLAEFIALQLPQHLAITKMELAARGEPWPLVFRKKYLGKGRSIFDYWTFCTGSTEFAHSIHIWYDASNFDAELEAITVRKPVCVDITALLTLQSLGLLEDLFHVFPELVLARGTIRTIRNNLAGFDEPHPLAVQLNNWLKANQTKIRVRPAYGIPDSESHPQSSYVWTGTLWKPMGRSFSQLLGDGVGESAIVAAQSMLSLYCDDVYVRMSAANEYKIKSFSSLALLTLLRDQKRLSVANEIDCLAKLLHLNFRHVRFSANHLHNRLIFVLNSLSTQKRSIKIDDLNGDTILGTFLRQFGDREITDLSLMQVACDWWAMLIRDPKIPDEIAAGVIGSLTYKCSQRALENILEGVAENRSFVRIAIIWAFFLTRLYQSGKRSDLPRAWSTIKSAAAELFKNDEKRFNNVLYKLVPNALYEYIGKVYPNENEKILALISIPQNFEPDDHRKFEEEIAKRVK